MERNEGIEKLTRLAHRLGIKPGQIKVAPLGGAPAGMTLALDFHGYPISRSCAGRDTRDENFEHLVLWLGDLVKNVERRIETVEEAFYADGVRQLPDGVDKYGNVRENRYRGETTTATAVAWITRATARLGLSMNDVKVRWQEDPNEARIVIRLPSGRLVEKVSVLQDTPRQNVVALALWLQNRAKNWERGVEKDLDTVFAGNLLPSGA